MTDDRADQPAWFVHSSRYEFDSQEELAEYEEAWEILNAVFHEHGVLNFHARILERPSPRALRLLAQTAIEAITNARALLPAGEAMETEHYEVPPAMTPVEESPATTPWWRRLLR